MFRLWCMLALASEISGWTWLLLTIHVGEVKPRDCTLHLAICEDLKNYLDIYIYIHIYLHVYCISISSAWIEWSAVIFCSYLLNKVLNHPKGEHVVSWRCCSVFPCLGRHWHFFQVGKVSHAGCSWPWLPISKLESRKQTETQFVFDKAQISARDFDTMSLT